MTREELKKIIKKIAIKRRSVILSSGKKSDVYYDIREVASNPEYLEMIAKEYSEKIRQIYGVRSVGGLATGSITLSTAVAIYTLKNFRCVFTTFYVRINRKNYGLQKQIEGTPQSPAVIIDDVFYSGNSLSIVLTELKKTNIVVASVIPLIFRGDVEKLEQARKIFGINIEPIFMEEDFTDDT